MRKEFTRLITAIIYSLIGLALFTLISCGGGGGDGGGSAPSPTPEPANYSGTWQFSGTLSYNNCNLSGLSNTLSATNIVTHSGDDIVLVSGKVTLTGKTHDEDGFEVYSPITTDSNGCKSQAAYRYEDASDGNAKAALAIAVQCGTLACAIGYGGTSVLQSNDTEISTEMETNLDSLMNRCFQQTVEKKPDSSMENLPLNEEGLKAVLTDVAKVVINKETKDSPLQ